MKRLLWILCLSAWSLQAENPRIIDLGHEGHTFEIVEENLLEVIQTKLKKLEQEGSLKDLQQKIQARAKEKILAPQSVSGITKASETKERIYDPRYTVKSTLKDQKGHVFAKAGDIINPLDHVSFGDPLLFIDGKDTDQLSYAKQQLQKGPVKIVLVSGRPLDLSKELHQAIYFDQGGFLSKKLRITKVPALVYQENKLLKIKEVRV
ncbi:MAG: type-F conjugative transfer system protein TraW [Rickettsiales bacterium]|nr:type-F conjugative transfer system protein TraW [Rickettsiales bacterium]|tara:strand:+ start:12826 stop:13446 length:621 start_codon:yes stop_codon:yes gene_type:complete